MPTFRSVMTEAGLASLFDDSIDDRFEAAKSVVRRSFADLTTGVVHDVANLAMAWASVAFPVLQLSHKLAASLSCTSYSPDVVSEILPPWEAVGVLCPAGAISNDEIFAVVCNMVTHPRPWRSAYYDGKIMTSGHDETLGGMLSGEFEHVGGLNAGQERLRRAVHRIIIGALAESQAIGLGTSQQQRNFVPREKRGVIQPTMFALGRPVTLDLRQGIKEWIATGEMKAGAKLTVQTLVKGHFKMQPHGEAGSGRKLIHVEPYWRGPEDAPIIVRPHRMRDGD